MVPLLGGTAPVLTTATTVVAHVQRYETVISGVLTDAPHRAVTTKRTDSGDADIHSAADATLDILTATIPASVPCFGQSALFVPVSST